MRFIKKHICLIVGIICGIITVLSSLPIHMVIIISALIGTVVAMFVGNSSN